MNPPIFALLGCVLGLVLVPLYRHVARRLRLLDTPNQRSSHLTPTPSSGGVAIIAALVLTLAAAFRASAPTLDLRAGLAIVLLLGVCTLGAVDDRRPLPVGLRLTVMLLVSCAIAGLYWPEDGVSGLWLPVTGLALAWLMNLYNFMDGTDGLAALHTVLCSAAIGLLATVQGVDPQVAVLAFATAGAYFAFLCFNWAPASLFMGDAGSLAAGFLFGWLTLLIWRDGNLSVAVCLILLSPFLLDTGTTLLARWRRGERLTQGHRELLIQVLAVALLLLFIVWLAPLAVFAALELADPWTIGVVSLFPQLFLIAKLRRLE